MKYTKDELAELKRLQAELHKARAHSKEAVNLGREIAEIHRQANKRNNPYNPIMARALKRLADKLIS